MVALYSWFHDVSWIFECSRNFFCVTSCHATLCILPLFTLLELDQSFFVGKLGEIRAFATAGHDRINITYISYIFIRDFW